MEDTDWRPSPCPTCGKTREAARNPVCCNIACDNYIGRTMRMIDKESKQYLWLQVGRAPVLVSNLVELYKSSDFDPTTDRIFEIGQEVKLELSVKVTPAKPVYRENTSDYRTPFKNRD